MSTKKTSLSFYVVALALLLCFGNTTNVYATNANAPIADAGPDQTVPQQSTPFGSFIFLDGSGSYDPDGDEITYSWTIETFPEGSSATILGADSEGPILLADIDGTFEIKLIVLDSFGASDEDTVTITVVVSGTVTVPNFVNMDINEVLLQVFVSGLELSEVSAQNSDDIPYEHIISQSIPAGSVVEYGTPISFVVSVGEELSVSLSASHDSPVQPGTTVAFTAQGEGGTGEYEYKFAMKGPATSNEFQVMQDYSSSNSWSWNTTTDDLCGTNIYVYARSIGSEFDNEVYQAQYFEVLPSPVTAVSLSASNDSPVQPGTTVVFTAQAEGGTGEYEYKFAMKGSATSNEFQVMQDYSSSNSWSWNTTTDDLCGTNIYVYARNVGSCADGEAYQSIYFEVLPSPVTAVSLTASHDSPVPPATTVVFTAQAEGGIGDFEYKFKAKGPCTGDEWIVAQEYSSDNTLSEILTCSSAGIYKILVYARSAGSCADYDSYAIIENFEILPCSGNNPPIAQGDFVTTDEDTAIGSIPVLSNDTDPDSDELNIDSITQPVNGTATNNEDGTLGYAPNENYFGDDTFTYTASDGNGGTSVGTVTVTVNPVNDAPIANAGIDIAANQGETVVLDGSSSHDPDGDEITYSWSIEYIPAGSNAVLSGADSVNPTFTVDVVGTYEFELVVSDGILVSTFDSVSVIVTVQMVTVPDLIGLDQTEAASQISSAGLTVGSVGTEYSNTIPANTVISQSPSSGSSVEMYTPVDFTVSLGPASAEVSLSPSTVTIAQGESATLSWSSTGAENAHIDNGVGSVPTSGTISVSPTHTTIYTLTVSGPYGAANVKAEVHVTAFTEPQPEGTFGETYNDEIPIDATVEYYDEERFALVIGGVVDVDAQPLDGVLISINGHPEYGTATTDILGQFTLPVEGGSVMTVEYQKQGLISSQRKIEVLWNNTAIVDTVTMLSEDTIATTVTFNGDPDAIVTHRSTPVSDERGERATTLVFSGDNQAYLTDENGNIVQELDTIATRATEYVTPQSMPSALPPTSGYTYCAELSVDGAARVRFEKPVVMWVDNFLGFQVGTVAPVGTYDRDRGVWIPENNGFVVRLLDMDSDGVVDALDSTGNDLPDDLDADGDFADEIEGLHDSATYIVGNTYWRAEISHFTPCDINWPMGPAPGATGPTTASGSTADSQRPNIDDCIKVTGSHTEVRSRIHHEDIPIPGTGMTLHYSSGWVDGYKHVVSVPASGDTIPASLKRIVVQLKVAGRMIEQSLDALPNQSAELVWDGLDFQGNPVYGSVDAIVAVGYVYDAYYYLAGDFSQSFGQNGVEITTIPARTDWIIWEDYRVNLAKGKGEIAEGWRLSEHQYMSLSDRLTLFKGDGSTLKNNVKGNIITTVAGNGSAGFSGDDGPATEAMLNYPVGVTVDASGNIYFADRENFRVRKIDVDGIISTVAGSGIQGYAGDGGLAINAAMSYPTSLSFDPAGNLYISDMHNNRIRKVDSNGIITTVAGNGSTGFSGDDGPATEAALYNPNRITTDAWGNLYICDWYNNRVRKVDTNGIITTFVGGGTGTPDFSASLTAISASLTWPGGIAADSKGNLFISSGSMIYPNNRIYKVDPSGFIQAIAGEGNYGYIGDGIPAISALLAYPSGIAIDSNGQPIFAVQRNHRVHMINGKGVLITLAGSGPAPANDYDYFSGDGEHALLTRLSSPQDVALDEQGNLYIADWYSHRIRKIGFDEQGSAGTITSLGDTVFTSETGVGYVVSDIGLHQETIDMNTRAVLLTFGYNENSELISITDQFGNQTTIQRDASGIPLSITSPDGLTTTLSVGANGHLDSITYPDNSIYLFEYTGYGLLTTKEEPAGNRFGHQYDANGRLLNSTDDEGGNWQYARTLLENNDIQTEVVTAENNFTVYLDHLDDTGIYTSTITNQTGAQTIFERSSDEMTVSKNLSCGMEMTFQYDIDPQYNFKFVRQMIESTPSLSTRETVRQKNYEDTDSDEVIDLITETVAINGRVFTAVQDTLAAELTYTTPEARTSTISYDPNNLSILSKSVPGLYDRVYGYDSRGRIDSLVFGTRGVSFTYDANGYPDLVTDAESHTTDYDYDVVGRLEAIHSPDSNSLWFEYDDNGNMTVLTNAALVDHVFSYNGVNLQDGYQTPLSGGYSYLYDRDRNLRQTTLPSGRQIVNVYELGRITQIQTPERNIDLDYSCGNKISSISDGSNSIEYLYDGKLLTDVILSGVLNQSNSYSYNNNFEKEAFVYAGATESYSYDLDGLLTGVGGYTITRIPQNGLPESVSGQGLNIERGFNGYGELESQYVDVSSQLAIDWSVVRDNNGRITSKTETVGGVTNNFGYTYDAVGRLRTVTRNGSLVEDYNYDVTGTRISEVNTLRGITGRSFSYSDEDHLLTSGDTTYSYNSDGFLDSKNASGQETLYTYSTRGELMQVNLPDGRIISYVNDPIGRRIAKLIDGVIVEKYLWEGLTRLLAVYDGSDNLIYRFEYADARTPVAMTSGGDRYFLAYDQVGSLRIVVDDTGNSVKVIEYDSFGNVIDDTNESFVIPLGFAGGLYDSDTGLVRFGYRDYDPDTGRWTAKDPIGFLGGDSDLYGYVQNNPINSIDPFGLVPPSDIPPGVNIEQNISEAQKMSALEFYNAVKSGGKWDYKTLGKQYEEFGNYNYGMTGKAAGFGDDILMRGAGAYQVYSGTSNQQWGWPWGGSPYGDDPYDQYWINEGINDYEDWMSAPCP